MDITKLPDFDSAEPVLAVIAELRRRGLDVVAGANRGYKPQTLVVMNGQREVCVSSERSYREHPHRVASMILFHSLADLADE
jgi:hypothetical protein